MDMQGSRQLSVTQQQAWDALNDPDVLKICVPGCDRIELMAPNQYGVGMALKVGPVSARFKGLITLSELNPPKSYTLSFDGQGGAAGFGKGSAKVNLQSNENGCELAYTMHAQVGGKLAQLGQRLIDGAAKGMAEEFFARFDEEMQRRFPSEPDTQIFSPDTQILSNPMLDRPKRKEAQAGVPAWVWGAIAVPVLLGLWLLLS